MTAELWKRRSVLKSCAISRTKALEGQLADEQLGALLVTTDLTKSDGTRPVAMWLLYSTGSWCAFARRLGRQLLRMHLGKS